MKHSKQKRLCSFILFMCLLFTALCSPGTANAESLSDKTVYVAFGDSIAAGYGLDGYTHDQTDAPFGSYQALTGDFLHTKSNNYAVSGDDSSDCISLLNSGAADADLEKADVITLSIGSNDLLLPFIQIVMEYFDIDPDRIDASSFEDGFTMPEIDTTKLVQYLKQAEELAASLADHKVLHDQAAAFPKKFQNILSILHEKAPAAEIYVTNIYNPFTSIPMIGELAETYISEINQAFSKDASDYTLVDVYTPFGHAELTNVNFDMKNPSGINLDPHPSIEGHRVIADLLIQALQKAHAPKAAVLKSAASDGRHRLSAKIKPAKNSDGYEILYASKKKGSYKTLDTASKKTYQTDSAKLKSGKTYYIKIRSFKTVKGVTYYGAESSIKKIVIKA